MNALVANVIFKSMSGWTNLYYKKPILAKVLINLIVDGTAIIIAESSGLNDHFRKKELESKRLEKEMDEALRRMCEEAAEQEKRKAMKNFDDMVNTFEADLDKSKEDFNRWCDDLLHNRED